MTKRKAVSKEEFSAFLDSYPRPLSFDKSGISDPPFVTYNDFTLGKWPESIVASHSYSNMLGTIPSDWKIKEEP